MAIKPFADIAAFYRAVEPLLLAHEATYNLQLGILADFKVNGWQGRAAGPPLMALAEDPVDPIVILRTPPHNLLLTAGPAGLLHSIVDWLTEQHLELTGVTAPAPTAQAFADLWAARSGRAAHLKTALRTHQLRRVIPPPAVPGAMRPATQADASLLLPWIQGFHREIGEPSDDLAPLLQRHLSRQGLWLWDHHGPVAMAVAGSPTPHGIRVNCVYTPREHRRHGYASALVGALSDRLLDSGRQFCFLFTDRANPTSNHIYAALGYEPVADFADYRFDAALP